MTEPLKTRPDRYRARDQALAYHASTNAGGRLSLSQRLELSAVRRALAATSGGTVLDVPCGTGRIDDLLRERFATVVGADSSVPMLSVYDDPPARLGCCADIFILPFDDAGFDWVVCHRFFHHLHNDGERIAALASLRRVCRRGVVFYAWLNTPFARRRGSMRASISRARLNEAIGAAGLRLQTVHTCAGPFSVKAVVVCTRD